MKILSRTILVPLIQSEEEKMSNALPKGICFTGRPDPSKRGDWDYTYSFPISAEDEIEYKKAAEMSERGCLQPLIATWKEKTIHWKENPPDESELQNTKKLGLEAIARIARRLGNCEGKLGNLRSQLRKVAMDLPRWQEDLVTKVRGHEKTLQKNCLRLQNEVDQARSALNQLIGFNDTWLQKTINWAFGFTPHLPETGPLALSREDFDIDTRDERKSDSSS